MSETVSERLPKNVAAAAARRVGRLRESFSKESIGAFLVNAETDIRYLTGFVGHDSLLLVDEHFATIISDPRYDEYLDPWRTADGIEVVMGVRHRLADTVGAMLHDRAIKGLGVQADKMTVTVHETVAQAIQPCRVVNLTGVVDLLRRRKDDAEIVEIERAVAIHQEAFTETMQQFRVGMTELELCATLEYEMKMLGATGASFEPIIGAGANSSIIHHSTGATPIEPGVLLVDWGAVMPSGYCSDMTRTFSIGTMPDKIREIYRVVLDAQEAAIEACAPGRTCAEVDAVARELISAAGYGAHFGHGLGHGLGLEVHETPYFNDLETDTILEPGMVMTVEPGIYLPGIGGVRIEDDVLITGSGRRVLGDMPKDLDSALIEPAAVGAPIAKVNCR